MKWRVCRKRGGESRYISLLRYIYFDVWYTLWANGKRACGNKKPIKPTLRTIFDLFIVFGCLIRGCKRLQRVRWNHLSNLQSIKVGFISILKKGEGALLERVSSTGGGTFYMSDYHLGRMCKYPCWCWRSIFTGLLTNVYSMKFIRNLVSNRNAKG